MTSIDEPTGAGARSMRGSDPDSDPRCLALAAEAFLLWTKPMSIGAIARRLNMAYGTTARYVKSEARRRAGEMADARDALVAKAERVYEKVRDDGLARMESGQAQGDEWKAIIAAQTALDRLYGLDIPVPIGGLAASPLSAVGPAVMVELLAGVAARKLAALNAEPIRVN